MLPRLLKLDGFMTAMLTAVALALCWPQFGAPGSIVPFDAITRWGISLVFFLHGANLSRKSLKAGAANWRLHILIQASTFVLFPLLGASIFFERAIALPEDSRLGIFFLCAVCSTISSSVALVGVARGNVAAAIFDASLSGLLGIVLTPLIFGLVHATAAGATNQPIFGSVGDIALTLLLPFAIGHLVRPLLLDFVTRWRPWVSKLDRAVIVLIVYTAFCQSTADHLWSHYRPLDLAKVIALTAILLAGALVITTILSRRLGFSTEDEITAVFCGSKKSLANGAPIAKVLIGTGPSLGALLLPLMLYHQMQLAVCTILAKRYAGRGERRTSANRNGSRATPKEIAR